MKKLVHLFTSLALATCQPVFADAVIFSGSDVKTLKPNIQLFNQAKIMSGTVDPTSVATSANVGSLYLNTSNGNLYRKLDSGSSTNWSAVGSSGASGINYITNSDIESSATGYNVYADAAGTSPVDGTGGTANVTAARTTTAADIRRGTASLKLTKDAADRQGQGMSFDIKVHDQDKAVSKTILVSFDYKTSANYVSDDIKMFVYDKDGATLLGVLQSDTSGGIISCLSGGCRFFGAFNTVPGNDDYRVIWHVATTNASAYDLIVDDVKAGPDQIVPGAIVTPWVSYTPTLTGFGTTSSVLFRSRRVGDSLEVIGQFQCGVSTAVEARISFGFNGVDGNVLYDATKGVVSNLTGNAAAGFAEAGRHTVLSPSTSQSYVNVGRGNATFNPMAARNGTEVCSTGHTVGVNFSVPITGWSSSAAQSTQETIISGCKVVAESTATTSFANGTDTDVPFATEVEDTCSAFDGTTFTAPKTSKYAVSGRIGIEGITGNCAQLGYLNVTNAANTQLALLNAGGLCYSAFYPNGSVVLRLNKGDQIKLRAAQNNGATRSRTNVASQNRLEIVEQPDFSVFSSYNVVDKQYDCSASGPAGWTTVYCYAIPYLTSGGIWRARLNLQGTHSSIASGDITISGLVPKNSVRQAVSCNDNSGGSAPSNNFTESGVLHFDFAANNTDTVCSGDVALESKPTFVP